MGYVAKDLRSTARTSTMASKSKKNTVSKERKDAEKKRNEKELAQKVQDQTQSADNSFGENCKKFILVDDYIPANITPIQMFSLTHEGQNQDKVLSTSTTNCTLKSIPNMSLNLINMGSSILKMKLILMISILGMMKRMMMRSVSI